MKSRFRRAAAAAVILAVSSGQALAHGGYSGWWIGGAALLGTGIGIALSTGPRWGYSGITYTTPPLYYPGPRYGYAAPAPVYVAPPVSYAAPVVTYEAPRVASSSPDIIAYPAHGQSDSQQARDREECRRWAMNQSGFDPDNISQYTTGVSIDSFNRAMGACYKGRGYSIN
ncbi:hypothetical protein [Bordetella petrii]|uniref:hypothetical protein n=1 Tax=Bordetella petrii TaxID=94624 RepID=UPI001E365739|nr:hypothetical protein [Bordetella petrii]MCD0504348.1 hypothetical protein [Bordetella petrii]